METTQTAYIVKSMWTTVSYSDTSKTEKVFEDKYEAMVFCQNFEPEETQIDGKFAMMEIESVSFVKRKEN